MKFNPIVIAPTFNNASTLPDVLRRLDAQEVPILAVNDGSTDETPAILAQWSAAPRTHAAIVETHPRNCGKAAALMTGFRAATKLGYTHALTIDTDGQLAPEQVPAMLELAQRNPDAIVLGVRDETAEDYPKKSRLGRRMANLFIWMESGLKVSDSQCGLRVYPLSMPDLFRCRAGRYGFESEVLARAGWGECRVVETPVRCTYFHGEKRVSHFRPWRDSFRAAAMHVRLVLRALVPFGRTNAKLGRHDDAEEAKEESAWRRFVRWISPREAWRQLKADPPEGSKRTAMAGSIAIGAFIGCTPTYGLHAILGLYAAKRLNLNPLGVILGTQVACPPLGIVLAMLSVAFGHIVLHGGIPPLDDFAPLWNGFTGFLQLGRWFFIDWIVGSLVVGSGALIVTFFIADWFIRRLPTAPAVEGAKVIEGAAGS